LIHHLLLLVFLAQYTLTNNKKNTAKYSLNEIYIFIVLTYFQTKSSDNNARYSIL
jgi:hypothetical protein